MPKGLSGNTAIRQAKKRAKAAGIKHRHPAVAGGEFIGDVVHIDPDILYELAKTHASFEVMAYILGVSASLLAQHELWRPIIEKARAEKKKDLLTAQFNTAINDRNPTMQIWLGKQYLEQRDTARVEHTGPNGRPLRAGRTIVKVMMPDNGR